MTLTAAHWRLWPLSRNFYYLPLEKSTIKSTDCAHGRAVNKLRSGKDLQAVHTTEAETETKTETETEAELS